MKIFDKTYNKHKDHDSIVRLCHEGPHAAQLRCRECDLWIKWLSLDEAIRIADIIGDIE